jgi:quinol monooxygenase YgiN
MAASPLFLLVRMRPLPQLREEARQLLDTMIEASRLEDGCELMQFVVAEDDPDEWLVFERWANRPLWEQHAAGPRNEADGKRLTPLLEKQITLTFYTLP